MKNMKRLVVLSSGVLGFCAVALGCGGNGASNNDQGVSVTFLGFFSGTTGNTTGNQQNNTNGCSGIPSGLGRVVLRLGEATSESSGDTSNGTDISSSYVVAVGVQNNLYGQYFRGDRLLLDYFIPGSSLQPPSTNVAISIFAGPASSTTGTTGNSSGQAGTGAATGNNRGIRQPANTSLPPTFSNVCNQGFSVAAVIPAALREWLNFNRSALPEPPYAMEVYARVTGMSSSGNRYETNTQVLAVDVLPEVFVSEDDSQGATPTPVPTAASATSSDTAGF